MLIDRIKESIWLSIILASKPRFWKSKSKSVFGKFWMIIGILFTIIKMLEYFSVIPDPLPIKNSIFFLLLIGLALVVAIIWSRPRLKLSSQINGKDMKISLQIGNILLRAGDVVVATNSTFDTTYEGDFISRKSLQAQLVKKEYSALEHINYDLEKSLEGMPYKELPNRRTKTKRYPIGTIAKLNHSSERRSYWVALADVNERGKPIIETDNLYVALQELWSFLATNGHMTDLYIPLLGSGLTGIDLPREQIAKDIIFSFVNFSNSTKILNSLTICFHPKDVIDYKMDVTDIHDYLNYLCRFGSVGASVETKSIGLN